MDTENREIIINLITIGSRCPIMKKRTFDQEYKIQAVELCLEGDKSIAQVEKELGLAYNALHRWVKEYKESKGTSFVGSGNIKPQNREIIELLRRNQGLEEE